MASYVTAVHTFQAEHGDELDFEAGDRIEVLERDDAFGDGWWRVSLLLVLGPVGHQRHGSMGGKRKKRLKMQAGKLKRGSRDGAACRRGP